MMRTHTLLRVLTAAVAASVLMAGPAAAHHDYGPRILVRDNNTQDYDHNSLTQAGRIACDHGAAQLGRSEISVEMGPDDIHCYDSFDPDGSPGTARCTRDNWWNGRCDHYRVWFNLSGLDLTPDTDLERNYWRSLGCHEFGHTGSIGHVHSIFTCMLYGISEIFEFSDVLIQDDLDHIDAAL